MGGGRQCGLCLFPPPVPLPTYLVSWAGRLPGRSQREQRRSSGRPQCTGGGKQKGLKGKGQPGLTQGLGRRLATGSSERGGGGARERSQAGAPSQTGKQPPPRPAPPPTLKLRLRTISRAFLGGPLALGGCCAGASGGGSGGGERRGAREGGPGQGPLPPPATPRRSPAPPPPPALRRLGRAKARLTRRPPKVRISRRARCASSGREKQTKPSPVHASPPATTAPPVRTRDAGESVGGRPPPPPPSPPRSPRTHRAPSRPPPAAPAPPARTPAPGGRRGPRGAAPAPAPFAPSRRGDTREDRAPPSCASRKQWAGRPEARAPPPGAAGKGESAGWRQCACPGQAGFSSPACLWGAAPVRALPPRVGRGPPGGAGLGSAGQPRGTRGGGAGEAAFLSQPSPGMARTGASLRLPLL